MHTQNNTGRAADTARFATKSKTSAGYWLGHVFKHRRKNAHGEVVEDADFSYQLSYGGRRERFQLHTANKSEAASRAASIFRNVTGKGWDEAIKIHKPKAAPKIVALPPATVGSVIAANERLSSARSESLDTYAKALRRLAAGVMSIKGGREERHEAVDAIPLSQLTPAAALVWKNGFLKSIRASDQGHASVTFNNIFRNAKVLVGNKVRRFLADETILPSPLFFEAFPMEKEPSLHYRSKINAEAIVQVAKTELAGQDD